ncbi:MAG TPA: signal peptidase II [Blastocatellia bacterium]|jgi:signal peptidase II|nr:signal peptidase II [Blastocatellia bacterium]
MSSEAITASASAGKLRYLFITALVLALDQLTKYWVTTEYAEGDPGTDVIPGFFKINHTKNTGIAFGMLNNNNVRWLLVAISVAAILIVIYYMMRTASTSRLLMWSLALLAAGIAGNLVDRIRLGSVIDFILLYYKSYEWPVFNVADTAITVGAALMAIELFVAPQKEQATTTGGGESSLTDSPKSEVQSPES